MGRKKENCYQIQEKLPKVTEHTEIYYLDEKDLPDSDVIKYSLNIMECPVITKNCKIQKHVAMTYIFNESQDEYFQIIPSNNPKDICQKILQEHEEKLMYGYKRIYEHTGNHYMMGSYPYFMEWSNIPYDGRNLLRTKDGTQRLAGCELVFNKIYYDPKAKAHGFEFLKVNKRMRIIEGLTTITFEQFQKMPDSNDKEEMARCFFKHKNIQEIVQFRLSDEIMSEFNYKGFKYFKYEDLIKIKNPTARKLWILLVKWRYWKKEKIIRRRVRFLASRIPLSIKHLPSTVRNLKKACEELKQLSKFNDYKVVGKGRDMLIDFYFEDGDQLHLLNSKVGTDETGHEDLEVKYLQTENIINVEAEPVIEVIDPSQPVPESQLTPKVKSIEKPSHLDQNIQNDINKLIDLVPPQHRTYRTLSELLAPYLKQQGYEYVRANIEYTKTYNPSKFIGYLRCALAMNYVKDMKQSIQIDPEVEFAKRGAKECYTNCNGSCASEWWRHKHNKKVRCFWCIKFQDQRVPMTTEKSFENQQQSANTSHRTQQSQRIPDQAEPTNQAEAKILKSWTNVSSTLVKNLPEHSARMWIKPLTVNLAESTSKKLVIICPNSFSIKRINNHFLKSIQKVAGEDTEIVLSVHGL